MLLLQVNSCAPPIVILLSMQLFPRLQELALLGTKVVASAAATGAEVEIADLAKRITSDVMGSMLLDQDFGGIELRYVGPGA
jgi:hypothetical protein